MTRPRTVSIADLEAGHLVLVRAGGRVPADGKIESGEAEFDESMITGESRPVAKGLGDRVVAGTVSTDSSVRVRVAAVGDATALGGHPPARRPSADLEQSCPGARRPLRRLAVLHRHRLGDHHVPRLVDRWRPRPGGDQHGHGSGDRLPARARPGDPARDLALYRGCGPQRNPRQGSACARADADHHRCAVRQDRHAHRGPPRRHRYRRCRHRRGRGAPAGGRRRVGQRTPPGPSDRQRSSQNTASQHRPRTSRRSRDEESKLASTDIATRSGDPACYANETSTIPESIRAEIDSWTSRGAAVLHFVRDDQIIGAVALEDKVRPEARQAVDRSPRDRYRACRDDHW